ncbi:hypothetical protein AAVH_12507 [Aphelenchoides avenae]|nr:hypothetical protein AAVH_12507 [Aphelenchus avenae]
MSDRIGEDALLDVGCYLNRFDVDSLQCLSWKSHTYLANKSHILPVRLLDSAQIGYLRGDGIDAGTVLPSVSARDPTRGDVSFDGTRQDQFRASLAAIEYSDIKYLSLGDPTDGPITDDELARIAAVASTVQVGCLHVFADLTHLPPPALHRLIFAFSSVKKLALCRVNGNQISDGHLLECARRQIWSLHAYTGSSDAEPLAISDGGLLDYLFTPAPEMRRVVLSAFSASPLFIRKLVSRAQQATNRIGLVELEVTHLPLRSQQLGGLRLTDEPGSPSYFEHFDNGVSLELEYGPRGFQATLSAFS